MKLTKLSSNGTPVAFIRVVFLFNSWNRSSFALVFVLLLLLCCCCFFQLNPIPTKPLPLPSPWPCDIFVVGCFRLLFGRN